MRENMKELVEKLNEACDVYYNTGRELMSNKEYDYFFDTLVTMEKETGIILPESPTQKVGAVVKGLHKVIHEFPALSLAKTKDLSVFSEVFKNEMFCAVMWKLDGATCIATYDHGSLTMLATRGNGEVGQNITHNAPFIRGLPLKIPFQGHLVVRGEATMSYNDFESVNEKQPEDEKYQNPRNLANATIQLYDSNEVRKRPIVFQAFKFVSTESRPISFHAQMKELERMGFRIVEYQLVSNDQLIPVLEEFTDRSGSYEFPVDGLVVASDATDYAESQPGTGHNPNKLVGYALKWKDESADTILRNIEWSASRTGLLNPVAVFDPVVLEGTTVSRATLHNVSFIIEKDLKIGDRITVYKANKIIPAIDQNLDQRYVEQNLDNIRNRVPEKCPICGSHTELYVGLNNTKTLFCMNTECPAKKIKAFVHFAERDCANILGISDALITKLVNMNLLHEYADFYHLSEHEEEITTMDGYGKKSFERLMTAIEESREIDFVSFIHAMGIANFGKGQAKLLKNWIDHTYGKHTEIKSYLSALYDAYHKDTDFSVIEGFGSTIHQSLKSWCAQQFQEDSVLDHLLLEIRFTDQIQIPQMSISKISGKTFVITGKVLHFANRDEIKKKIESLGGKVSGSVSKNTDYLINNDVSSASGKNKKALELAIPIISESDFLSMCE